MHMNKYIYIGRKGLYNIPLRFTQFMDYLQSPMYSIYNPDWQTLKTFYLFYSMGSIKDITFQ